MKVRGHPQPPEHDNSVASHLADTFWQKVEETREDTPAQRKERHDSDSARWRLAHKGDLLEARRVPADDDHQKQGKRYNLTDDDKRRIRQLRSDGLSYVSIAEEEDISRYHAWKICREGTK